MSVFHISLCKILDTILEINTRLAEKSRENNELQVLLVEQKANYESSLQNLQRETDDLETEKDNLATKLQDTKLEYERNITTSLEGKNLEITRLQNEVAEANNKFMNEHRKLQTTTAKVEVCKYNRETATIDLFFLLNTLSLFKRLWKSV